MAFIAQPNLFPQILLVNVSMPALRHAFIADARNARVWASNCDKRAALRLIRKLLRKHGVSPTIIVTDRYREYGAAFNDTGLHVDHVMDKRANNRIDSSHVPVRRRERKRQGFKSARSAQSFLSMHAATYNLFNVGRHLTTASTHRLFRATALGDWRLATAVAA